ncbi:MAG TPA: hypothetical protein VJ302_06715, partial [Blastocatellia bacterium]|nr:hypothetical protein [Blastocatellia bacterium]
MGLQEIYEGRQSWAEFLASQLPFAGLGEALKRHAPVQVRLSQKEYQQALDSGLGAIGQDLGRRMEGLECSLELGVEKLTGGLGRLNADFNLLMGDLVWKFELSQETLNNVLQEIRLAEFEREARAYRSRAERAYLNGWYEEALGDFLEAEKRNYPDYAVHRSIASIYLYHLIDLPGALDYFRKAAKYSRPCDHRQSAEAHYFAGMVCWIQQRLDEAGQHLREATALDPELFEAHYQLACLTSRSGEPAAAVTSLETAINGDARYYERARTEPLFDVMRSQVEALLTRLMQPVREQVATLREAAQALKEYVVAEPETQALLGNFERLAQQPAGCLTYQAGLELLQSLSQAQDRMLRIHDRFYKKYEIDPRDYVRSIAFSRDGRLLASGFLNGGLRVWEADSGLQLSVLSGHLASVNSVAFSLDDLWIASGGRDRKIKLWEALTGREIQTLS